MLLAIEAVVCFTPLGSLPALGPIAATLGMVPVAITGILLGIVPGAAMGAFAGLFSFCVWTFTPPAPPMAFIFTPVYSFGEMRGNIWSLVICFVPRILVGVMAAVCYQIASKPLAAKGKSEIPAYILGAVLGSLMNTFGVLGGIYLFFGRPYAKLIDTSYELVLLILGGQVLTSGIPEAVICALVAAGVCGPIKKLVEKASV